MHVKNISGQRPLALLNDGKKVWATVLFQSAIMHRKVIHVILFIFFLPSVGLGCSDPEILLPQQSDVISRNEDQNAYADFYFASNGRLFLYVIFTSFNEHCLKLWVFLTVIEIILLLSYFIAVWILFIILFRNVLINSDHIIHYTQRNHQELFPVYIFNIWQRSQNKQ